MGCGMFRARDQWRGNRGVSPAEMQAQKRIKHSGGMWDWRARASLKMEEKRRKREETGGEREVCDKPGGGEREDIRFACRTVKLLLVAQLVTPFSGQFTTITWALCFRSLLIICRNIPVTFCVSFFHTEYLLKSDLCKPSIHVLIPVAVLQDHIHHLAVPGQLAHVFLQNVDIIRPLQRFLSKLR